MEIKKRNSERLVIAPTLSAQLPWMVFLAAAILITFRVSLVFIAISVVLGLYILGELITNKIVIDKPTESIVIEKRRFLLIHRQRVIPFSAVTAVRLRGGPVGEEGVERLGPWQLYLDIPGKRVKIAQGTGWEGMGQASEISRLIGKEPTREDAVASFKKRIEQDTEERNKGTGTTS